MKKQKKKKKAKKKTFYLDIFFSCTDLIFCITKHDEDILTFII